MSLLPPHTRLVRALIPVWDALETILAGSMPQVGDLKASMKASSHGNWLLADGLAIPSKHKDLIALIGVNTPDWKGRALVGAGAGTGLTSRTVGEAFGNEALTEAQMPPHNHPYSRGINIGFQHAAGGNTAYHHTHDTPNTGSKGNGDKHWQPSRAANIFIYAGTS